MDRASAKSAAPVLNGSPNASLFGATLGFFIGFGAVALFGATAGKFKDVMQLSPYLVGYLVAIPMLTGSLLRIPFGAWVDTTGGKKPFLLLLLLSLLGMGGLYGVLLTLYPNHLTASHYPLILLLGALAGCGIATFSVGIGQISYWFPQKRQGWALGAYAGFGNAAPALATIGLPAVTMYWGLSTAYLISAAILIVGILLYSILGKNAWYFQLLRKGYQPDEARVIAKQQGQEIFPRGSAIQALTAAATTWRMWPLVILYFTTFGGFLALTAWFPTFWKAYYGVNLATAVSLTAGFSLLTSLIRVPGGIWADRMGGERVAIMALVSLLLGALIVAFSGFFAATIAGALLMAVGMGVNNAAVFKLVPRYVEHSVGGAAGWVGGLGAFGGFAVPPLLGWFATVEGTAGYARGFLVYVGLAFLCLLLAWFLRASQLGARRALA